MKLHARIVSMAALCLLGAAVLAVNLPAQEASAEEKIVTLPSGLKYVDLVEGTGPTPQKGQRLSVNYVGRLDNEKGRKFDSSYDRQKPFKFYHKMGMVITGWDEGVATMKVGGKRKLIIPPRLGYGSAGAGDVIPPNATLYFEIELLAIDEAPNPNP